MFKLKWCSKGIYLIFLCTLGLSVIGCKGGKEEITEKELPSESKSEIAEPLQAIRRDMPTDLLTIKQIKEDPSLLTLDSAFSGEIEETMDSAGYTYMKLKNQADSVWVAVSTPPQGVKKGDRVTITKASVMSEFHSKSLDRTFDIIIFGQIASTLLDTGVSPPNIHTMNRPAEKKQELKISDVPKATGDNAYTIAEIFAKKEELADKEVTIRGVVVKYSSGILGKNWLHLQDGTGTPEGKDNDLTITTTDKSKVGDTVLVNGIIHTNIQVGPGYFYDVIIEDTKITVEKKG